MLLNELRCSSLQQLQLAQLNVILLDMIYEKVSAEGITLRLMCRSSSVTSSIPICLQLRLSLDINASLDTSNFLLRLQASFTGYLKVIP